MHTLPAAKPSTAGLPAPNFRYYYSTIGIQQALSNACVAQSHQPSRFGYRGLAHKHRQAAALSWLDEVNVESVVTEADISLINDGDSHLLQTLVACHSLDQVELKAVVSYQSKQCRSKWLCSLRLLLNDFCVNTWPVLLPACSAVVDSCSADSHTGDKRHFTSD